MSKYTIMADIGKAMINMLRDKLVPEPLSKAEQIGLCDPKERGNYVVGVHAYDLRENNSNGTQREPIRLPNGMLKNPPSTWELYYMISVASKSDLESKALDEAKIIGRIIQIFQDNPVIPAIYVPQTAGETLDNMQISSLPLSMEEKVKVWTMFGEAYKLSVFYLVGPITIDSNVVTEPHPRVETIILGSSQDVKKRKIVFETKIKEEDIEDEEEEEDEDEYGDEDSDDEDSDDEDSGEEDSGEEDSGEEDSGDEYSGEEDSGDEDSGEEDSGEEDSGDEGSGEEDSGEEDSGEEDSGDEGSGEEDSGEEDSGEEDSGDEGSGEEDSGDEGSGEEDSGEEDSGDEDSGEEDSGEEDSGEEDSGEEDSGEEDSGEEDSGDEAEE